jgi:hypothetical protein
MELDRLDILAQAALSGMTRTLLIYYLQPEWIRTPVVVALARQYYSDLGAGKEPQPAGGKDGQPAGGKESEPAGRKESQPEGGKEGRPEPDKPKDDKAPFPDKLKAFLARAHPSIREYFAYVLLDHALADPDLKDLSLGHARALAEDLGLAPVLEPIIKKEMTYNNDAL